MPSPIATSHYVSSANSPVGHVSGATARARRRPRGASAARARRSSSRSGGAGRRADRSHRDALAIGRNDRRLRERDEIANSIGVPVLASFPVAHPADAAGWTKLLEDYKPAAVHALQLRQALQQLGTASVNGPAAVNATGRRSPSCLFPPIPEPSPSVPSWRSSPRLRGSHHPGHRPAARRERHGHAAHRMRRAAAASSKRPSLICGSPSPIATSDMQPDAALTVVVAVVDGESPQMPDTMRTTATVLGVSAGAATAEQLARVAVSAALDGREIAGILVADPEPADRTTGRIQQLPPSASAAARAAERHDNGDKAVNDPDLRASGPACLCPAAVPRRPVAALAGPAAIWR